MLKLLVTSVCLLVALKVVDGKTKGRKWGEPQCDPDALPRNAKPELLRCQKDWTKLSATLKSEILTKIKAKIARSLPADKFAKIPLCCLNTIELDGITVAQILASAATGDSKTPKDGIPKLTDAKKAELLADVLNSQKPSVSSNYGFTLTRAVKKAIGRAVASEVVKKGSTAPCEYIIGAMSSTSTSKADVIALLGHFITRSCQLRAEDLKDIITKAFTLTNRQSPYVEKMAVLKIMIPHMTVKECRRGFRDSELLKDWSDASKIEQAALGSIPWQSSKCPSETEQIGCKEIFLKILHKKASLINAAAFKSLGTLVASLQPSTFKTVVSKIGNCASLKLPDLFKKMGKALPIHVIRVINNCVKNKANFGVTDWTTVTVAKLKDIASHIPFLEEAVLLKIPKTVLCDASVIATFNKVLQYGNINRIKRICDIKFDRTIARQKPCGGQGKGKATKRAPRMKTSDINTFSEQDCADVLLDDNMRRDLNHEAMPDVCNVVSKAYKKDPNTVFSAGKVKKISKCLGKDAFKGHVSAFKDLKKLVDSDLDLAQQLEIFDKLTTIKPLGDWTPRDLDEAVNVIPEAFRKEEIDLLTGVPAEDLAKAFSKDEAFSRIRLRTIRAIWDRIVGYLSELDEASSFSALETGIAANIGPLLAYLNDPDDIKKAPKEAIETYCESMKGRLARDGDPRCSRLPDLTKVYQICKDAMLTTTNGQMTDEDIDVLGDIACNIPKDDIATKLTDDAFRNSVATLSACENIPDQTKTAFTEKAKKVFGADASAWAVEDVTDLGDSLRCFESPDLDKIPAEKILQVNMHKPDKSCSNRRHGRPTDSADDYTGLEVATLNAAKKSQTTRRRRAVTLNAVTLSTLTEDVLLKLTVTDINSITAADAAQLITKFAAITGWSVEQITAFVAKVKTALSANSFCNFTPAVLNSLGTFLLGISTSEISCLDLSGDKATPLSQQTGWTQGQYVLLAAKFKTDRSLDLTIIDASKLQYLGSFMCGLSDADINKIPAAVLKAVLLQVVGYYQKCSRTTLRALLTKVKEGGIPYGSAVSSWTASEIAAMKDLITVINEDEIKALDAKIGDVKLEYLEKIDSTVIIKMTVGAKNKLSDATKALLKLTSTATGSGSGSGSGSVTVAGGGTSSAGHLPTLSSFLIAVTVIVTAQVKF